MPRLLIVLLLSAGIAHADCYTRGATVSSIGGKIERVADYQYSLLPAPAGTARCRVTFRALINDRWYTAEGETAGSAGQNSGQVCAQANNTARASVLESVNGTSITAAQELICTDQPIPQTLPRVNVGDVIRDSEVQPHPNYRKPFRFRGTTCRWFIESRPESGAVDMNQGVMCATSTQDVWRVVDKW